MKRTLFIGDVHGCYDELIELLSKCCYVEGEDRLIFVGDILNKGPKSKEVIEFIMSIDCELVLGNHEIAFLQNRMPKLHNQLEKEFGPTKYREFLSWLKERPCFIEDKDFIVTHGGIVPGKHPRDSDCCQLASIRTWDGCGIDLQNPDNPPWYHFYHEKKIAIFGHWAVKGLIQGKNYYGLDSGCVYGRKLSSLIFPNKEIVQVDAHQIYLPFDN